MDIDIEEFCEGNDIPAKKEPQFIQWNEDEEK